MPNRKKRLAGDTTRQAHTGEGTDLRAEALALKELVADLSLENRLSKKNHDWGWGCEGRTPLVRVSARTEE